MILVMSFIILTSCSPKNDDNAKIQIWTYKRNGAYFYNNTINSIKANLEHFCESNSIPYEIIEYDSDTITYENYVLKRNVSIANGNAIVIDDARWINDLSKKHADYSKIPNYTNLLDVYKDRFCIPLGIGYSAISINNETIKHYGIDIESNLMDYYDYLKIIQEMKEKGAKFNLAFTTFDDIVQYYMLKNNIRYINEDNEIVKSKVEFKEAIKKTFEGICDDLKLYYPNISKEDIELIVKETNSKDNRVIDEATGSLLIDYYEVRKGKNLYPLASWSSFYSLVENVEDKFFVIYNQIYLSPCIYIYKKVTNNKVYDVVNSLLEDDTLAQVLKVNNFYSPVADSKKIRENLEVDENWQHKGLLWIVNSKLNNFFKGINFILIWC